MIERIRADIDVAAGRAPADLALRNGRFFDVFTGDLFQGDMAIRNGCIVALGAPGTYRGIHEVNLQGKIVIPGLIDSHVHIESSMHGPSGFASLTVPRGTTTVIADPHEIANVRGMEGIRWMLEASELVPQSVYVMLPSCVPATPFEDAGAVLGAKDLQELIDHPRVLGLGEAMDYPGVAEARDGMVRKIALARERGKRVDGHSPSLHGRDLAAYAVAGISTDHECTNVDEMRERLRLGMRILIRQGTAARDLEALVKGLDPSLSRRCCFCTDDKLPGDILSEGHIDSNVRGAIREGIAPSEALRLATINGAEAYGLEDRGALVPGRRADFAILSGELEDFEIQDVYIQGTLVAQDGALLEPSQPINNSAVMDSVRLTPLGNHDLDLPLPSGKARVIQITPGSLVTHGAVREVSRDEAGNFRPDAEKDLLKIVVVERHKGTGRIGLGVVEGYGLKGGATASSIAHDSHNLIAIGDDDAAILAALRSLASTGGGITVAGKGGQILGTLPLPLGGLMSDQAPKDTAESLENLIELAHERLGIRRDLDPFMPLSFLALPVIPELKITAKGLFDVSQFSFVSVDAGE
ncbi:MAG: adenine deaminase [Spirochaetales bacterium]|nr:adenine deaminase [Spirochaetales bacterium]